MEQILLSQLSSLKQVSFNLLLQCNTKKIVQFRRELSEYLVLNSITVDIIEKEDNLLTGDKVQLVSEVSYNNDSKTIECIYTGGFNSIIFEYVLNHCKQKVLMSKGQLGPGNAFRFKIEPLIRIEPIFDQRKGKKKDNKMIRQEEDEPQIVTQRNSAKSNRNVYSSRKNEEDHSKESINHEYHGRKCYCCSNRSKEESQLQDEFSIFSRVKKANAVDKENSGKKTNNRVSDFNPIIKRTSPQPLAHQLSVRGASSQSERKKNSPNLYFRKHLLTIANNKEGEESNRNASNPTGINQKVAKTEATNENQQNKWIKTKRNDQASIKKCQIDDDKITQLKKVSKLSTKIPKKDDKVFQRAFKHRFQNNNAQFSEEDSNRDNSKDSKQIFKGLKNNQTAKNSFSNTKMEIEQRYSQMIAPNDHKLQAMGGYSIDQKNNQKICPGLQKMAHHHNQSLQSWFKNKKELDPITKIKLSNEAKIRNHEEVPMIMNKSKEKASSATKPIIERQSSFNIDKSLSKNNQNCSSSNRLASNRIKKIPLTQKMQMIKQGQEKIKTNNNNNTNKKKQEIPNNSQQGCNNTANKMNYNDESARPTSNNKQNKSSSLKKTQKGRNIVNAANISKNYIQTKEQQQKNTTQSNKERKSQSQEPQDDNFSVTQQRISNKNSPQLSQQTNPNKISNKNPKINNDLPTRKEPENDLASTIKQINYENDQANHQAPKSEERKIEQQVEDQDIRTSRTIPIRNESVEPLNYDENQLKNKHSSEQLKFTKSSKQQEEYFDKLLQQNEVKSQQQQKTPKMRQQHKQSLQCFGNCDDQFDDQANRQTIVLQPKRNPTTQSVDFLQDSQPCINQQPYRSQICCESQPSQSYSQSYSTTTKMQVKPESSRSMNRLSIDGQLISPRKQSNKNIIDEKSPIKGHIMQNESHHQLFDSNLEEFEKELFEDSPKTQRNDSKEIKQEIKGNKLGVKDYLRLQTIDEVNQSIYRLNQKKQIEEKLNSVSISSSMSNNKLKENVSNASSEIVSDSLSHLQAKERNNKVNDEQLQTIKSLPIQSQCIQNRQQDKNKEKKQQQSLFSQSADVNKRHHAQKITESAEIQRTSAFPLEQPSLSPNLSDENERMKSQNINPTQQKAKEQPNAQFKAILDKIRQQRNNRQELHATQLPSECQKTQSLQKLSSNIEKQEVVQKFQPFIKDDSKNMSQIAITNQRQERLNEKSLCQILNQASPQSMATQNESFQTAKISLKSPLDQKQITKNQIYQCLDKNSSQSKMKVQSQFQIQNFQKQVGIVEDKHLMKSSNNEESSLRTNQQFEVKNKDTQIKVRSQSFEVHQNENDLRKQKKGQTQKQKQIIIKDYADVQQISYTNKMKQSIASDAQKKSKSIGNEKNEIVNNNIDSLNQMPTYDYSSERLQNQHSSTNQPFLQDQNRKNETRKVKMTHLQSLQESDAHKINKDQEDINQQVMNQDLNNHQVDRSVNQIEEPTKNQERKQQNPKYVGKGKDNIIENGELTSSKKPYESDKPSEQNHQNNKISSALFSKTEKKLDPQEKDDKNKKKNIQSSQRLLPTTVNNEQPVNLKNKKSQHKNSTNNKQGKANYANLAQKYEQYPSKASKQTPPPLTQQNNIQVQTDYILPIEQPESTEKPTYYKSQSDHLSKKKCKINLCEPQIINNCNNFESSHQIQANNFKKENKTTPLFQNGRQGLQEETVDDRMVSTRQGERKQPTNNNALLVTQPSVQQFEPIPSESQQYAAKDSTVSNIFDMSHNNEAPNTPISQLNELRREDFKLNFKTQQSEFEATHPQIMNRLIYKNIHTVRAHIPTERSSSGKKTEIIANCLSFVDKFLPNFIGTLMNKQKTEACLFINNQWMLFCNSSGQFSLNDALQSQLREQSTYKCLEMITGMPMRILKDKQHDSNNKRLIKSLKTMLEKRDEEKTFETVMYGLNKMNHDIICLDKIRYFLDNSKQSKSILECRKVNKKGEEVCNFQAEAINEFIQIFLLKNPKYLTLQVDPSAVNTYEIELSHLIFYVSGNYKFILYEQTSKNEYKLIKESYLWLKHKNERQLTRFLLILQPIPKRQGQHVVTLRLATDRSQEQGNRTNRVIKYQNGGKAKGYQGGYQNQKNLYLPVYKQITECDV